MIHDTIWYMYVYTAPEDVDRRPRAGARQIPTMELAQVVVDRCLLAPHAHQEGLTWLRQDVCMNAPKPLDSWAPGPHGPPESRGLWVPGLGPWPWPLALAPGLALAFAPDPGPTALAPDTALSPRAMYKCIACHVCNPPSACRPRQAHVAEERLLHAWIHIYVYMVDVFIEIDR